MSLHITPAMLVGSYEYLLTTPPFRGWKLPPSDEIGFVVTQSEDVFATFRVNCGGTPIISISAKKVGQTNTLHATMAHEMWHLYQHRRGERFSHKEKFRKARERICAIHGFDLKAF